MSNSRGFKRKIRERMATTGEHYTAAMRALQTPAKEHHDRFSRQRQAELHVDRAERLIPALIWNNVDALRGEREATLVAITALGVVEGDHPELERLGILLSAFERRLAALHDEGHPGVAVLHVPEVAVELYRPHRRRA